MATDYNSLINVLWDSWQTAQGWIASLAANYSQAAADWNAGDDHAALEDVIQGMWDANQALVNILKKGYYGWDGSTYALLSALDRDHACPFITEADIPSFNMDAILSVMLSATPEQVEYFVGLVDAYRQSIWNRPFNQDFYAALARGFMIWP